MLALNAAYVERCTSQGSDCFGQPTRTLRGSPLHWSERSDTASLDVRVKFINEVVSNLVSRFSREQPITLISYGAGGLLTEHFIYKMLLKNGFDPDRLHWRLIDINYGKGEPESEYQRAVAHFQQNQRDAREFRTERAYIGATENESSLLRADRASGPTVLFSIDPPWPVLTPQEKR